MQTAADLHCHFVDMHFIPGKSLQCHSSGGGACAKLGRHEQSLFLWANMRMQSRTGNAYSFISNTCHYHVGCTCDTPLQLYRNLLPEDNRQSLSSKFASMGKSFFDVPPQQLQLFLPCQVSGCNCSDVTAQQPLAINNSSLARLPMAFCQS